MALTTVQSGMMDSIAQYNSFKNRIINGAMVIDQRNAGASVAITTSDNYTLDRWLGQASVNGKLTIQQNSTAPTGFINSLLCTSASAYSILAGDYFLLSQYIEGLNCADLGWGTASAATVTLSFWVRSSLTGTFAGSMVNSGGTRSYPFTYTISSANTWEQKSITIAGDTTGTWLTTNGVGIRVRFGLGVGSTYSGTAGAWTAGNYVSATGGTSLVGTSGATFYITGVQLEKGSTATAFDYRPYTTELQLCQRYLPAVNGIGSVGAAFCGSTTIAYASVNHPVTPRVAPTGITTSAANTFTIYGNSAVSVTPTAIAYNAGGTLASFISISTASGLTNGSGTALYANGSASQILFTGCEL